MRLKERNLLKHNFESLQYMSWCVFILMISILISVSLLVVVTGKCISLLNMKADLNIWKKTCNVQNN